MITIGSGLAVSARHYPEEIAIVFQGCPISYRMFNERVNRLSHHMLGLNIQKGDSVGMMFYNSSQFLEIFYAVMKIGAVAVPVNFRLVPREVKWILDNSRCIAFAYSEACRKQVDPVKKDFLTVEHLIFSGQAAPDGEHHFETITSEGNWEEPGVEVEPSDRAYITYTGGTTGFPKGVVHTHYDTILMTLVYMTVLPPFHEPDEASLLQLPMFHIAGLATSLVTLGIGGKVVVLEGFDPLTIMQTIEREQISYLAIVPPILFNQIMSMPNVRDFDTTSVTKVVGSGGFFSKSSMLKILDIFPNANLFYTYGLSEAQYVCAGKITRTMVEEGQWENVGVGRAIPYVDIKLVDEEGEEVSVGDVGEAAVRSPMNMQEYFEQPELTARTIKDGWLYTGDLLRKDENGFYSFMGRNKDMIKSGGENVFAEEVEGVIATHPSVDLCAVIGVPDPRFGEGIVAVIKLRSGVTATEEEIIAHCKLSLAGYKKPRRVVFVDDMPIGGGMKIQKFKLIELFNNLKM
jgi:acyl-CoA synthetase (AMP-forming)/AMP-acid ligase II